MPVKPMLDDVELQHVQKVDAEDEQVLAQHGVPALDGDFLQDLGRRVTRVTLVGVMTGPEAGEQLKTLRLKFRNAEPVSFVSDIATATTVDKVLIEEFGVRELAGKPARFEFQFTLREFQPAPAPEEEEPPPPPPAPPPPSVETGTLVVTVTVDGEPGFDFSKVTVTVDGTKEDGSQLSPLTLTNRTDNVWTEENMVLGNFTAHAVVTDPPAMSGSAPAAVRSGQTTQAQINLQPGAIIATTFVVHFRFDNSFIEPCMREVLDRVAQRAAANPDEKLLIVGHTDKTGDDPPSGAFLYNQSLSERRARSVFAYLNFDNDQAGSEAEWKELRQRGTGVALPRIKDTWGTRQYQYMLQSLRFYPGNIDGDHGPLTDDAVRTFRAAKSLPAGTTVDDDVWEALIHDYLAETSHTVPDAQFLRNAKNACNGGTLKWLGCGEEDPLPLPQPPTGQAHRQYRRTEMLFVRATELSCEVPQPDTFDLPAPGSVNATWCLGPGNRSRHCCFATRNCPSASPGQWCITPAETGSFVVRGRMLFEDGTPAPNVDYLLIAPDGEFMDGEIVSGTRRGEGRFGRTRADGTFEYPANPKSSGTYTMEVQGPFIARLEGAPQSEAKGSVVCKLMDGTSDFNVVIRSLTTIVNPIINLASAVVVVKKTHTNPARQIVTVTTDGPFFRPGTLDRTGVAIRFFDAAVGGTEITFNGTDNVFSGAQLSAGVQLFAESDTPSLALDDVVLTLTLTPGATPTGPPATATMTAVELTLDIAQTRTLSTVDPPLLSITDKIDPGRVVIVQDAAFSHERATLIVQPPNPNAPVTLRLAVTTASAQLFTDEIPAAGQVAVANPNLVLSSAIPPSGQKFFVEGRTPSSTTFRDTQVTLGIDGVENDGDHVVLTVFPDPSIPGPFAVGEHEYTRATPFTVPATTETLYVLTRPEVSLPTVNTAGSFPAQIRAVVRYPAVTAGVDQDVATTLATYPLVVIAHGNHRTFDDAGARVQSFRGLEYLARHLASYGYIAVSIDLEDMNLPVRRLAIIQRGLTILEHLEFWTTTLNVSDPIFTGRVDLGQIGLIGHSRGAEAVVSAQSTNISDSRGFAIRNVISISPTDFLGITHSTTPYLVIYGSTDGDVSIGWPFRLYDRATQFKAMVFVYAANHNFFSTNADWLNPTQVDMDLAGDSRLILEANHLNIARGYCLGFLQLFFRGVGDHMSLFKKRARLITVPGTVEIQNQVQDTTRLTVDNFEQGAFNPANPHGPQLAARATTSTILQTPAQTGLVAPGGSTIPPGGLTNPLTEASLRRRDLAFFFHDTFGEMIAWNVGGGTYTQPLGTADVSAFEVLSFRVTQRFGSARNPDPGGLTPGVSPDFSVTLVAGVQRATVRVGSVTPVPFPYKRSDTSSLTESALSTIRIPLTTFTSANPTLDLRVLTSVVFQFDQTARGEIAVDDLEFSV